MKTNKILILSICTALVVAAAATGSFWFLRDEKKPESKDFSGQTLSIYKRTCVPRILTASRGRAAGLPVSPPADK